MTGTAEGRRRGWRRLDPRVVVGFAITGVTLWYSFRDLSFATLARDIARADLLWLLLPSVPAYAAILYVRALRWRHLCTGIASLARGPFFRATSVGFMANNVFPLRIGEVVRAWYLAREGEASRAAVFGTIIVERMIDAIFVLGMAAVVLGTRGAQAAGVEPWAVLAPLLLIAALPIAFVSMLTFRPGLVLRIVAALGGRVLPARWRERLEDIVRQLATGMRGLAGPRALAWVLLHSLLIWGLLSAIPFAAALIALDVPLEGPGELVSASLSVLVWVGAAVALPSAPGFFGPYHAACWVALRPFGVPKELAVALGTLAHAVFWLTTTGIGLLTVWLRRAPLVALEEVRGSSSASGSR